MRFFNGLLGFFLLIVLSDANVVQRRTYRNNEEIFVPVAIIQDGGEIIEPAKLKELEVTPAEEIPKDFVAANEEAEKNLEIIADNNSIRRIDEAIIEEEIEQAVKEEQILDTENKLKTTLAADSELIANEEQKSTQDLAEAAKKSADYKTLAITAQSPEQVLVVVENNEESANNVNGGEQEPVGVVRQATQATPAQTSTQQNFVQQLIQNSPLGQFFNQLTGQTAQTQVANDAPVAAPVPPLPGLFNPVAAVQTAAQTVVNSTTQAIQGFQQFASTLGNQFQNTLSSLGGQPAQDPAVANDAVSARPPGPIQQLVSNFLPQQTQPAPAQPQGPLQGLLSIFQGRPQQAAPAAPAAPATQAPETQPPREEDVQEQTQTTDEANNEVRDSAESNDSFEESVQPEEIIVVNDDDVPQIENDTELETTSN